MRNLKRVHGLTKAFFTLAACALALLAIAACGDSTDGPPSPTPQSVLFATPPAATDSSADDQPDPGIVVQLDSTPTPYPTSTPYPTATPYPTPLSTPASAIGPTVSIEIPTKAELQYPEVGSRLNDIVSRVEAGEISAEEAAGEAPIHRGDSVGVTILLSGNVDGVVRFLENNGGTNVTAGEDYIEAYVPVLLLVETSQQPGVLQVRLIQPPGETQGTSQVVGNGPGVHGSPSWNQAGYTGRGIKVGVIDVGFWGLDDLLGTEVPAVVQARCYTYVGQHTQNLSDCGNGGVTHGTAVSESVIDIAPDVSLYISDPQTRYELADAVDWMISEGVSVINHSALWSFDGSGDGTSPLSISPLNTIDTAVDAGIVWVNAAGNQARGTWFKRNPDFTPVSGEAYKFLRFSGSNTINAQSYIGGPLELRWEDEWGRAGTDLDLLVYKQGNDEPWLQSIDTQSGENGHYPYESVSGRNPVDILIVHRGGPDPDWIQLVGWGQTRLTLSSSGAGSIINPAESANPGMLAVGAAPWGDVNSIESYSSRGPTPDGRVKPDVVGADCGETASGEFDFCGTSQAAPHVAGMAALVRQRFPDYTPAQVVSYLKENAQQRISSPDPNNTWGHGFLVLPTVTQQQPVQSAPGAPTGVSAVPGAGSLTVSWSAPPSDGGSSITAYDLRHIRSDATNKADANWTVVQDVWTGSGALQYVVTGLTGGTQYDVQARAVNSAGDGPWSATVTGTPTQATPCATGGAVTDRANNSLLISDCDTLLEVRDTLAGTVTLNWAAGTPITNWDGIAVGGTPQRIIMLYLPHQGLTGILPPELGNLTGLTQLTLLDNKLTGPIPSELANLSQLTHIFLGDNQLSGPIPSELGRMTKLQGLELYGNRLTGTIPTELGRLTSMQGLHIDNNQLTGTIPAEMGRLISLRWLTLHDNRLTGEIPAELGRLTNLEQLYLSGNRFSGCVPTGLRGISETDRTHLLKDIGIPYCDVLLSGLRITSGTLSPQFDAYVTDYRVEARASQVTVSLTNRHNATFEYLDRDDNALADADGAQAGYQVDAPATMATTIKIKVTSSDGNANHTYTIQLTGPGALGAPEVHQVTAGTNSLTVSWTAPSSDGGSSITAYDLRHIRSDATNKGDANWTVVQDVWTGSGARSYELADLDGGTQYDVQVRAVNAAGDGPWSLSATGTPTSADTTPGSPANAQYERVGTTTVVTWDPSAGATHYKVYYDDFFGTSCRLSSGSPSFCELLAGNVTSTTYTHASPDDDTNYYWITACNSAGCSDIDSGNPAQFTATQSAATAPGAPTGLTAAANGQTQIDLSWTAPSDDGGSNITGYKIEVSTNGSTWSDLVANTNSTSTSYSHTGLTAGSARHYRVSAINSAGTGPASNTANATTAAAGVPSAPIIAGVVGGADALNVSWSAPSSDGGSPVTAYDLRHIRSDATNKGDANWTVVQDVWTGSGSLQYVLTGLSNSTQYDVQVRAVNAVGDGSWSATAPGTTASTETTPGSPANAQYVRVGTTTVVSWDPSAGATHYNLYHSDSRFPRCSLFSSGSTSGCDELAANVAATTYEHTSPDANTNSYWITACNAAGCSEIDSANPAQFVDSRPAAPTGAQYERVGTTAVVTWDQSTGATHYKVYYDDFFGTSCRLSSGNPSFCELLAGNVTSTTYTHTSPDEDRNYYWVVGCNSAGCSDIDSGNPATLVETTRSATAPGAPTRLTATANGQTRIDLSWTAPSNDGGANITGYRIEESGDGSNWSDLVSNTNSTSTSYSHTGLMAGSTRHYRVSAINSVGTGTASNVDNAATGTAPAPDLVVGTPTVDASAPAAGARFTLNATVRNQGSGPSAFTTLRYYQSTDSTITTGDTEVGTDSVFRLDASESGAESVGLTAPSTPGTYYYGACVDPVTGESDTTNNCSAAVTVTVGASATAPGAPTGLTATADGQTEIDLSWNAPSDDGGSPITAYDLRHIRSDGTNKGDANWTLVESVWTSGLGALSYELAGLTGGTQYDVQVKAVNAAGDGPWSSTATGTPTSAETTPGSPANAQYVRVGSTTVVSWDPSAGATHYKLYHSDSRFPRCSLFSSGTLSGCDELAANVSATTYAHANPDAGTNNYWITACNAAGCSEIDSGNPARFVDSRPAAPTSAQYVRVGSTTVITWDPSAGATHYKVYYDDFFGTSCRLSSGSPSFCELLAGNVTGTTYTHASPDEDRNYYWVVGCNSAGCSDIDSGNPATLVETTRSATAPGAPTRLTATANGQTRIDLSWIAPSNDGGANITGYKIEVSTSGSTWSDLLANSNSTSTSYSHTGLTAGSTRHYRVSAINSEGTGSVSNVDNATTSLATQGSPDLVVDNTLLGANVTPGYNLSLNATVSNQGDGPSVPTTLRYYHSPDAMITTSDTQVGTDRVDRLVPSGSIRHAIAVTVPSTPGTYYYGACVDTVPSESDAGNNCSTATEVTVRVVNRPPQVVGDIDDMTVTLGEFFQVDISGVFSEPDGEDVQNYGFTLRTKGILSGTVHTQTGILNLRAIGVGATTVAVEASDIHGNGSGPHDLFVVTVVPAETTTAPDAPTGLSATADGQAQIDLSWSVPSDDGGANITGYKIEISTSGSTWSDLVANTNSTATSYTHTGLTAESTRHYRVSAINSAGTGSASNVDNATTDPAAPPAPDGTCSVDLIVRTGESCTYPGTSTEFSVASDGTGQFLFTSSGSKIELRNTTINGVTYTFVASKQGDGNWLVEEVG